MLSYPFSGVGIREHLTEMGWKMSDYEVTVSSIPKCDIHKYMKNNPNVPAVYDGKTVHGPWANMCDECYKEVGTGLGLGKGQRFVLAE